MTNRYYTFDENEYYHLYNRGNSKQIIFKGTGDFTRFKQILYIANSTQHFAMRDIRNEDVFSIERDDLLVHIGAYCLMSNHFHILLTPVVPKGVSKFMLKLMTSYSSYFNNKYERSGGLFEGPYKARHADTDNYLKYLFAYIHLNPFKDQNGKISTFQDKKLLAAYSHSSLPDYLGVEREDAAILNKNAFPKYFNGVEDHLRELRSWFDYSEI